MSSLSPYARVARAVDRGRGVRLSYEECVVLIRDDGFETIALRDLAVGGYAVECPACEGLGCDACNDAGYVKMETDDDE